MSTKNSEEKITLYIVREHKSSSAFGTVVPRKGVSETDVSIKFMLDCVAELGFANSTIYLNNDQEPAIKAVMQGVIARRAAPTLLEESPVGSSQSNGPAESAVSIIGDGIRKLRIAIENRYAITLPVNSDITTWLVLHAGFVHNRFQVGHDGKTPHSRIRGRPFNKELCEFAQLVHYKIPKRIIGPD